MCDNDELKLAEQTINLLAEYLESDFYPTAEGLAAAEALEKWRNRNA